MVDLIYTRKAANTPLSFGDIARLAPAAFATEPVESVTDKYRHISTFDVMRTLKFEGWLPVQAAQSSPMKNRYKDRTHQRHLIAFAREADLERPEGRPEIVLYNSSDKSSSLKLYDGFFRWICSNSLVAGEGNQTKIRHLKTHMVNFDAILGDAIDRAKGVGDRIERFRDTMINYGQARQLIASGLSTRWTPYSDMMESITPHDPLINGTYWTQQTIDQVMKYCPRNDEDCFDPKSTYPLWNVFNRTQEYVMRGGLDLFSVTDRNQNGSYRRARGIGDPRKAITINADLWDQFEGVAA